MPKIRNAAALAASICAVGLFAASAFAASDFAGVWKVEDTGGKAFEITLSADGAAKANRAGEGMTGTWKADEKSATITWNTGWTTKISKDGEGYTKSAYDKGQPLDGKAANTSKAEKVK